MACMPAQFEYSGVDRSGQPIQGLVEGESPISVVLQLKTSGVRVYSIKKKSAVVRPSLRGGSKVGASDLIVFNSQLASLLKTKLPLSDSLRHLSKELRGPRFKTVLGDVATQVESGRNLSESLSYHEGFFPPLYLSMVEAGEKSGNLAEVLFQASQYLKSIADFRRKFLYILFYPAVLSVLALGVLVFLLKVMVPPYIDMYSGFHVEFPPLLKLLVGLEEFLRLNAFWMISVPVGAVAVIVLVLAIRRSEAMRMFFDRLLLKIPLWGEMMREVVLASSFSTLAILLRSGVPLYESLKVARDLISNRPLRRAFELGADEVLEGQPFSVALVKQPLFPLEVAWVVKNGEARGDLIGALDKAQKTCQSKFEFSSQIILSVLEPALLIVIGAIIVSITISLFYPLYSLSSHFGI
jgi:general secretion pathway protein F